MGKRPKGENEHHPLGPFPASHADRAVLALAARQHGVVTRAQLLAAGVHEWTLERRVTARRLRPVHRAIYLVGPVLTPGARALAAVLACGADAVASHWTAAGLWAMVPERAASNPPDVALSRGRRRRPGILVRRLVTLCRSEITVLEGIPITTPTRTLLDLATVADERQLARAAGEALGRRQTTRTRLRALLELHAGHPGARALRRLLAPGRLLFTRSQAEERFHALVGKGGLPVPEGNVEVEGYEVDFYWRKERLIVEVDGFAVHTLSDRFEKDRLRDATLAAAGIRVIRVTWQQLTEDSHAVLVRLAQALVR